MYILNLLNDPLQTVIFLFGLVAAVTIHEFAHAWTAYKLGDETPYLDGRVTLNPAAHLDPIGSLLFLFVGMGWGRPVIYNPMRLSRRVDELLIALAGPGSNLLSALVLNILALALSSSVPVYASILSMVAQLNVLLAAFNMIPIPPLDGSAIVAYFYPEYRSIMGGQIGILALFFLIFVPVGNMTLLSALVGPIRIAFTQITTLFGLL